MTKQEVLQSTSFGQRVAEDERQELENYFVATDQWRRTYEGKVDVVYGAKGAGKSAVYSLLMRRAPELLDKGIIVVSAEQPRGTPIFKDLRQDPPTTEAEFSGLWRLYFLSLLGAALKEYSADDPHARRVIQYLSESRLLESTKNLATMFRNVLEYAKRIFRPSSLELGGKVDPLTGLPNGFYGKISFDQPPSSSQGVILSVNDLLESAEAAFKTFGYTIWILLDRLDVAFAESQDLEENALRSLFRTYLDFGSLEAIKLKIFLRSDIWTRLTKTVFREASHITRKTTILWDRASLLSLIMRRAVNNPAICEFYGVSAVEVLQSIENQESLFYRIFPERVDAGVRKPRTLDWILGRTKDGSGRTAPREVIHLLNAAREIQLRHIEIGNEDLDGENLLSKAALRESLPEVSEVRLTQTLFAEYPQFKPQIERLAGEKTEQYPHTLAGIWGISEKEATALAVELSEIGFFEQLGTKAAPSFRVPFLYRDAAKMVQGAAD